VRLVKLSEWAEQAWPSKASRPCMATLYRWIREGDAFPRGAIKRYGSRYFVDLDLVDKADDKVDELVRRALGEPKAA
jgi:hypothetical protein